MAFVEALGAAKTAYDFVALAIKARDAAKIQAAMADLREKLWEISNTGLSQLQTLHSLELEAQKLRVKLAESERVHRDLEAKIKEEAQYQITEVCPGGWAYMLISDMDKPVNSRPYFCPACHSNGKKVPMRHYQAQGQLAESWTCMVDNGHRLNKPAPDKNSYVLGHDPRNWQA